jgi:hypothetical protein
VTRAEILRDLLVNGHSRSYENLHELAGELGLPAADVFVIAGQPVPARLLPPARDAETFHAFTYRVTFCNHAQLAALESFVLSLPRSGGEPASAGPIAPAAAPPGAERFPAILDGLMRNRGFGVRNMPFTGLSVSTIHGMVNGRWYSAHQVKAMAGPLGWACEDLIAVAGQLRGDSTVRGTLCRHVGKVYTATVPLTSGQMFQAAVEADRLSGREDHGAWKPWNPGPDPCPDDAAPGGSG